MRSWHISRLGVKINVSMNYDVIEILLTLKNQREE